MDTGRFHDLPKLYCILDCKLYRMAWYVEWRGVVLNGIQYGVVCGMKCYVEYCIACSMAGECGKGHVHM